jgi:hypothetical protein
VVAVSIVLNGVDDVVVFVVVDFEMKVVEGINEVVLSVLLTVTPRVLASVVVDDVVEDVTVVETRVDVSVTYTTDEINSVAVTVKRSVTNEVETVVLV